MSRRLPILTCIILVSLLSLSAEAASKAKLVKEGKSTALTMVTATRFAPADGPAEIFLLFTPKKADVVMVNSFGEDSMALVRYAMESNTTAVKVSFKEKDVENYSLSVYSNGEQFSTGGHSSGGETRGVFKKVDIKADKISGEIKFDGPPGAISGIFDAAIATIKEAPTVKGAAVAKSPQAATLIGFAKAMAKMDIKAAQAYSARNLQEEFGKAKEMIGEAELRKFAKETFGDHKKLEKLLKSEGASLAESGDMARIRLTEKFKDANGEGSHTQTHSFVKVNGKWKVE